MQQRLSDTRFWLIQRENNSKYQFYGRTKKIKKYRTRTFNIIGENITCDSTIISFDEETEKLQVPTIDNFESLIHI